ncbi:hypothetical protein LX32DRAFT_42840 [Colletotrichum zoysiae]|uniref:Uncharacterized protein n=1 Tax=Colletotrichum zoysiae TaxID=1216348 RepID=A0AAD9M8M9_9PEZI|nr:hypothetical protein LX32DRAFT_42840 [Colletotrichum zoysiae]
MHYLGRHSFCSADASPDSSICTYRTYSYNRPTITRVSSQPAWPSHEPWMSDSLNPTSAMGRTPASSNQERLGSIWVHTHHRRSASVPTHLPTYSSTYVVWCESLCVHVPVCRGPAVIEQAARARFGYCPRAYILSQYLRSTPAAAAAAAAAAVTNLRSGGWDTGTKAEKPRRRLPNDV